MFIHSYHSHSIDFSNHSFTQSIIYSLIHWLICSLTHLLFQSLTLPNTHLVAQSFTHSFIHSLVHSTNHSLTRSIIYSPFHWLIRSITHSPTHSLFHSMYILILRFQVNCAWNDTFLVLNSTATCSDGFNYNITQLRPYTNYTISVQAVNPGGCSKAESIVLLTNESGELQLCNTNTMQCNEL